LIIGLIRILIKNFSKKPPKPKSIKGNSKIKLRGGKLKLIDDISPCFGKEGAYEVIDPTIQQFIRTSMKKILVKKSKTPLVIYLTLFLIASFTMTREILSYPNFEQ
jgi:hypothetical protein